MFQITELYIYPIKSLGGLKLDSAIVTDRGLKHDRRWMLIDDNNRFISQREFAQMALLKTSITNEFLVVTNTYNNNSINITLTPEKKDVITVSVWDDRCLAQPVSDEVDAWFSEALKTNVRLVYMPNDSQRFIEANYAVDNEITSFSDAFPFLLIGQSSLDDLNDRLDNPLPINRFRPNIVFTGGEPYFEDIIDKFTVNGITFNGVKLCARCNMITINQNNATSSQEPTKTLATYRAKNKKIYFGQNLIHAGTGTIAIGDELKLISTHTTERFFIPVK
jgi:uncharacterized protein YcbX